jgi:hypothetical protein
MPMSEAQAVAAAASLEDEASAEWMRLRQYADYYRGEQRAPYTPKRVTVEFHELTRRARTNLLPNVVSTIVDRLYVDGYRADIVEDAHESPAWSWWQMNGLDSRQKNLYEMVFKFGYGYMLVWPAAPGEGGPMMRPKSPRTWYARYDHSDDDFPRMAIKVTGNQVELLDDEGIYLLDKGTSGTMRSWTLVGFSAHGLGVTPLVRYMNAWPDDEMAPLGEVEKLIDVQDRLNQSVFDLLVTQTYMGAPQQFIAGVVADADDKVKALAKRIWTFDSPATQVGQLPQADLRMAIAAIENSLRMFGIKAQMPPNVLLGEMVNISADALVAANADLEAKVANRQSLLGESHEQAFRLAGVAANDPSVAADQASQVVWRRTDPRSLASTVDALGKMAQMLNVPSDELWPMIPGVTQTDVQRWREKTLEGDPFVQLDTLLERQQQNLA